MINIHRAKLFVEETLLGYNSEGIGFFNESGFGHFQKSFSYTGSSYNNHAEEIISVGLLRNNILEIGVNSLNHGYRTWCDCLKNDLCRKMSVNSANVIVTPKNRYQAHYKISIGEKVAHANLAAENSYGTIGGVLLPSGVISRLHIVSNNHVLADSNNGYIGDDIYHMGAFQPVKIGTLKNYVPLSATEPNKLDLAIAELPGFGNDGTLKIGKFRAAILGERVYKLGARTGRTEGFVRSLNYTTKIDYAGFKAVFTDQIQVAGVNGSTFSLGGDSGSVIKASSDGAHVGLLFGGNGTWTVANHQTDVARQIKKWF